MKKTLKIIAAAVMLASVFCPWFMYNTSVSVDYSAVGLSSANLATSTNTPIYGISVVPGFAVLLVAAVGILLPFVIKPQRVVVFIADGTINLILGILLVFKVIGLPYGMSSLNYSVNSAYGGASIEMVVGFGVYVLIVSSLAYIILGLNFSKKPIQIDTP